MRIFADRHDAGARLARALHHHMEASDTIVVAHSHASVPVAYEIATRLALPLALYDDRELPTRRTVVVVDDGDSGRELPIAIQELRARGVASVVAAIGVASPQVYAMLHAASDELVCAITPQHLFSIDAWYANLAQPSEEDVQHLLVAAAQNLLLLRRSNFLAASVDR
jgi:predicted phosphoribosyltransferase